MGPAGSLANWTRDSVPAATVWHHYAAQGYHHTATVQDRALKQIPGSRGAVRGGDHQ